MMTLIRYLTIFWNKLLLIHFSFLQEGYSGIFFKEKQFFFRYSFVWSQDPVILGENIHDLLLDWVSPFIGSVAAPFLSSLLPRLASWCGMVLWKPISLSFSTWAMWISLLVFLLVWCFLRSISLAFSVSIFSSSKLDTLDGFVASFRER